MSFSKESELKDVALEELPIVFDKHDGQHVFEEFSYGAGRTDIVIAGTSASYLIRRLSDLGIQKPIKDSVCLKLFLVLHRKGRITIQYFRDLLGDSFEIRSPLEWLISNGFVEKEGEKVRTAPSLRRHVTTSYAVELKISDWKRGLNQAARAKSFAEYQYVALPSNYVHRAVDNLEYFSKYNVGIISITEEGNCTIEYSPDREQPCTPLNAWRVNEMAFLRRKELSVY